MSELGRVPLERLNSLSASIKFYSLLLIESNQGPSPNGFWLDLISKSFCGRNVHLFGAKTQSANMYYMLIIYLFVHALRKQYWATVSSPQFGQSPFVIKDPKQTKQKPNVLIKHREKGIRSKEIGEKSRQILHEVFRQRGWNFKTLFGRCVRPLW